MNQNKYIGDLAVRYGLIVLLGLGSLSLYYFLLTPPTIFVLSFILGIFTDSFYVSNIIFLREITIEIIPACVAGSAFYLLTILNLGVPNL